MLGVVSEDFIGYKVELINDCETNARITKYHH